MSLEDAKKTLRAAGMIGEITVAYSGGPHGNQWVCGTMPSDGQQAYANADVEIDYCKPDPPHEPHLVGGTLDNAKRTIGEVMAKVYPGLEVSRRGRRADTRRQLHDRYRCATSIRGAGTAFRSNVITIHVAK